MIAPLSKKKNTHTHTHTHTNYLDSCGARGRGQAKCVEGLSEISKFQASVNMLQERLCETVRTGMCACLRS